MALYRIACLCHYMDDCCAECLTMSGLEIERKFLVKKGDAYKQFAFASSHIQQGYLPCIGATVRIRTRDDKAYLTIKGKATNGGLSRYEFETEITMEEASHLFKLCQGCDR